MLKIYIKYDDHGIIYYYLITRNTPHKPLYRERIGIVLYMAGLLPKLQFFAGYIYYICYELKKKLIVFFYWPMVLWHIKSFLLNIGTVMYILRA